MSDQFKNGAVIEGRYRIVRRIGEGGMGVVYEAEHTHLIRRCALKVLHPTEAGDSGMIERFKAEAQSAANIRHPNIVEVLDFGLIQGEVPFLVMEFLKGESLADKLDREIKLSEREAVVIADQILSGLSAAHKYGVIHRDLKPENIHLALDDQKREIVKILDFGISKFVRPASGRQPLAAAAVRKQLTQEGTILGTPGYMAPETLFGTREVDARADLFSVGVILFEMLTGRQPFRGSDAHKIMLATATKPVPRPSQIRPGLSPAMEKLVLISLAKEPEDRFQTATEFLLHLTSAAVGRLPDNARECRTQVGVPSIIPSIAPPPSSTMQSMDIPMDDSPKPQLYRSPYPPVDRLDSVPPPRNRSQAPLPYSIAPAKPVRRRSMSFPFTPFQTVFLLVLAGAVYYFFFYKEALITDSYRDPVDAKVDEAAKGARSSTENTENIEKKPGAETGLAGESGPEIPAKITVWIDADPYDLAVKWGGRTIDERPLIVAGGKEPVLVVFNADGYKEEQRMIVPDREQVLKVRLHKIKR